MGIKEIFGGKQGGLRCEGHPDGLGVNCEVYEPMGSEVYLYLNTGKHTFIARVGAHDKPKVNADMDVVFDMSKVHFFDKNTEDTIV